jgi:hypothetical protein
MSAALIRRAVKQYVVPHLVGFQAKGRLVFEIPCEKVLRGLYFENSTFNPQSFCVYAFVQPLYVPWACVHFTFGIRLGNQSLGHDLWWDLTNTPQDRQVMSDVLNRVRDEGLPFLSRYGSSEGLARWPTEQNGWLNAPVAEGVAYSAALCGDRARALELIGKIEQQASSGKEQGEWLRDSVDRMRRVRDCLDCRDQLVELLAGWEGETIAALKLGVKIG